MRMAPATFVLMTVVGLRMRFFENFDFLVGPEKYSKYQIFCKTSKMKNLDRELSHAPKIIKIRSETQKLQPFKVGEIFKIFGIWRIFVLEILDFHPKTVSNLKKV